MTTLEKGGVTYTVDIPNEVVGIRLEDTLLEEKSQDFSSQIHKSSNDDLFIEASVDFKKDEINVKKNQLIN